MGEHLECFSRLRGLMAEPRIYSAVPFPISSSRVGALGYRIYREKKKAIRPSVFFKRVRLQTCLPMKPELKK